jgi:MFS family permease
LFGNNHSKRLGLNKFQNKIGSKGIFIVVSFIIIALIVDTSIVKISAITGGLSSANSSIAVFVVMTVIFAVGQYLILGFVGGVSKKNESNEKLPLSAIGKIVSIIQYVLIAIFVSLILQMLFTSSYNVLFLEVGIWISYILAIALLGFLSQRFLSWFRSHHDPVVLAYSLAIMMISINAIFTILYINNELRNEPVNIRPEITPIAPYESAVGIFSSGYVITSFMSFILTWVATVLLLRNYSRKLGTAKYWILVSIPLVYFLSQFQPLFLNMFEPFRLSDPILFGVVYTLFFSATVPAGAILFGIAFWSVARNMGRSMVKQYMMISAYGMMLLFSSNQASGLVLAPYPPFGLVTACLTGLSSYLVLLGIYSSAISVSEDAKLRQSIRKAAMADSRILDSIGTAQMEQELQNKVLTIAKKASNTMTEETGVQTSLTEEDMKQYLDEVIKEIQKKS